MEPNWVVGHSLDTGLKSSHDQQQKYDDMPIIYKHANNTKKIPK